MPFRIASSSPPSASTPRENHRGMKVTPQRTALASIKPSPTSRRPALAEKPVPPSPRTSAPVLTTDTEKVEISRLPTAMINVECISDVMASRLAMCLLGHVLFLKSQVPFPVAQLIKMSLSNKADPRTNKKQDALIASFDLLSSHLGSTFTALGSKLTNRSHVADLATSHLAIILGPSVTSANAARARVLLEIKGLHVPLRSHVMPQLACTVVNSHLKENEGSPNLGSSSERSTPLSERSKGLRVISQRPPLMSRSDESSGEDDSTDGVAEAPPDSDSESESIIEDSDSDSSSDVDSEEQFDSSEEDNSEASHEVTEADLCAAERLLSRTLAVANADPELGMAADIRPTQTRILLRAPRCFSHPAWIPHQNLSRDMDPLLREFIELPSSSTALHDITNASPIPAKANEKRKVHKGVKTDYVRVSCRGAANIHTETGGSTECQEEGDAGKSEVEDTKDDMIWWSWDGKLEGFTDF
ncbi:uncharacterized protein FOMMEDRAFT_168996 [Fomitiporia mediterranea MF3/22]|uniref:uncharacterized protein n=1 Tax=Fomitiporia mediterranea (strain MF3/22) TaxID=694068 RepID=UPI0004409915|nr:uncharacterized protein FOMMEDRAFT_168996 [Fomitiporia mediterranea MF3/22]EJD00732.1 hypothetical protein FOMMEDRAFT_168996 [Fomitiporia mediterranea MF3/22]